MVAGLSDCRVYVNRTGTMCRVRTRICYRSVNVLVESNR